jgi:hypothetical protein
VRLERERETITAPSRRGKGGKEVARGQDSPSKTKQLHLAYCRLNSYNYRPSYLIMAA